MSQATANQAARSHPRAVRDFYYGVATSAFQIEGATAEDGRGACIWDDFCREPGAIQDGTTGEVTCDHYHRWPEDVAMMADLGVQAYRFSVSWPRVLPQGTGRVNDAGLDFYDRLVDALLEHNIEPFVTLYHWDLPSALQAKGGWMHRDVAAAFVPYTRAVASRLGDRVNFWVTHNEPWCTAILGHQEGAHAPGLKDTQAALQVAHHLLLSHGWATRALRDACPNAQIGLSHLYLHCDSASDSPADLEATQRTDGLFNRWYLDPLYGRGYPEDVIQEYRRQSLWPPGTPSYIQDGDLEVIATPTDFLGINYYTRGIVRSDRIPEIDNAPQQVHAPEPEDLTDMHWEVYPKGLEKALVRVHAEYAPARVWVTENGAAFGAEPNEDGLVADERRIEYLSDHLEATDRARAAGVPVGGYLLWSFIDNFEWSYGHTKRFGIVWVDFKTQVRTLKDSARWYRHKIAKSCAAALQGVG